MVNNRTCRPSAAFHTAEIAFSYCLQSQEQEGSSAMTPTKKNDRRVSGTMLQAASCHQQLANIRN
jgi:hypothetical protein